MGEWRELYHDEWGPQMAASHEASKCHRVTLRIIGNGDLMIDADQLPLSEQPPPCPGRIVRALLRAHDLRTKAPGTECEACDGTGPLKVRCARCLGSGRNLTYDEMASWRRHTSDR